MLSFFLAVFSAALHPSTCAQLWADVQTPDAIVIAPATTCAVTTTKSVADGVRLIANGLTVSASFPPASGSLPVLNVTGVTGFEMHGGTIHLGSHARGIRGDSGTSGLTLKNVQFIGDMGVDNSSSMAVWLSGATGTQIVGGGVSYTWAGYYVVGGSNGTRITDTQLVGVNYESITVQGDDITISNNTAFGMGVGYPGFPMTGTGTNVADGSTRVRIVGNRYQDGHTYGIRVFNADAEIVGNYFGSNSSAGLYGYPGARLTVVRNQFADGASWGIALDDPFESVIRDNLLIRNSLWVRDGDSSKLGPNTYRDAALPSYVGDQSTNLVCSDLVY